MLKKTANTIIMAIIILNGIFFMCNIYVLGNRAEIIKMHQDLVPSAGDLIANAKVIGVFATGVLYIITAVSIIKRKYWISLPAIILGFLINNGLYVAQLIMWANMHPRIWIHMALFGGLNLLYVVYVLLKRKKRSID